MCGRVTRLLALAAAVAVCRAYRGGAPPTACSEMTPGHGLPAQDTPMPYNITLSSTVVKAGRRMTVTISRGDQPPFKGFFVQVRYADDPNSSPALGRFMTRQHSTVTCQPGENNGISHADNKEKESVTLLWLSPPGLDRDVQFRVSVVRDYNTYWVGHDSAVVRVLRAVPAQREPEEEEAPVVAVQPAETPKPTEPPAPTEPAPCTENCGDSGVDALSSVYDGCGSTVGCFAASDGCVASRSCQLLVTYALRGDGRYQLQLYGRHESPGYLAVGLSTDTTMGDDDVIYCADNGSGGYEVKHAFNHAVPKRASVVEAEAEGFEPLVSDVRTDYRDGVLRCAFSVAPSYIVEGRPVDLSSGDLHLMVASGPLAGAARGGGPGYHSVRRVSGQALQLRSPQPPADDEADNVPEDDVSADPVADAGAGTGADSAVYDGCGSTVGCFAASDGCVASRSCQLLVTYALRGDGRYQLQLYGRHESPGYLAVGLSTDTTMGDDDVIYCADDGSGGYEVKHAFNHAVPKRAAIVEAEPEDGEQLVSDVRTDYRDGVLRCAFSVASKYTVDRRPVDLSSGDLHLMVARGPLASTAQGGGPGYHSVRRVSGGPVQLQSQRAAAGPSSLLFRLHGALMIGAWLGTASIGMLLARYYKQTWAGRKLAGLDLWFQSHRTLMVVTLLLAIGALVCIVLQLGGWTATPLFGGPGASPHPLLGVLCLALGLLQPLMAACRCHPGAPRRAIFNWLHWMVGTAAHILGVAAIFFAVELPDAKLPDWTYWVLAAFVVFHVFTHFILSVAQCWSDRAMHGEKRHGGGGGEAYNMRDMGMNSYHVYQTDRPAEAPGSTLRRTVLGIYIVVNLLFVALLVCMVVLAPADEWLEAIM